MYCFGMHEISSLLHRSLPFFRFFLFYRTRIYTLLLHSSHIILVFQRIITDHSRATRPSSSQPLQGYRSTHGHTLLLCTTKLETGGGG